jgi:hypothetical protein
MKPGLLQNSSQSLLARFRPLGLGRCRGGRWRYYDLVSGLTTIIEPILLPLVRSFDAGLELETQSPLMISHPPVVCLVTRKPRAVDP